MDPGRLMDHPYHSPAGMITAAEAARLYPVAQQSVQEAAVRLRWKRHLVRGRAHAFDLDDFLDWYQGSRAWRRRLANGTA